MPEKTAQSANTPEPKRKFNLSTKLRIVDLLRPHWTALTLALLAVLGETLTDVLEPWPVKIVVDNLLQHKRLPNWIGRPVMALFGDNQIAILNFAVAAVAAIAIVGALSSYAEKYLTTSVSQWVTHDLRRMLYGHIQRLSLAEYDETRTGDLISRVTSDINAVQDFVNTALLGMIVNVLTLVGMIGVMFYINWRFTLIALSVSPILFAFVYVFTRRIKKFSRAVRKKESDLTSVVQEVFTSIRVVKAFAREDYEQERFEEKSLENVETALKARSLKAKLAPMVEVIVAIGTCLVLGYGARLVLRGSLSAGVLIVFLLYLGKMYKPMRDLSKMTDTVSKATVGYERIQEVLEIESKVRDLPKAKKAPKFKGKIEFEHVSFSYDAGNLVLRDINFSIQPGQIAALVGPSGTGKTTVISLIPRFYDPTSGKVKIDDHDVREYTLKSLRQQISFVLQDTLLFHATIWENIAYGCPDAPRRKIEEAARLANAHEFIEKMPEGYDTMVGERGISLSGGQRQRIAIARAIIRDTPILILDEPTSGLDAASEQTVIEALDRLMKGRTTLLIAHHLGTIQHADCIFVIKDSELVEQGTHEELLAAGGTYAELYKIQTSQGAEHEHSAVDHAAEKPVA
ncbi:MAG TPA: ABC transporter ATP-binding protein [Verrucomicrobiae bacterium]|jgi:subfamily B ATP-binding cassette protein MsbA|nr:ABC transporter ATP-binding protein [Verrucomicrobiae bacterium]